MSGALRVVVPTLLFLFNTGLTVSDFNNTTVAFICWALMLPTALIALYWPRLAPWAEKARRIRFRNPFTLAPASFETASTTTTGETTKPVIKLLYSKNEKLSSQRNAKESLSETRALKKEIRRALGTGENDSTPVHPELTVRQAAELLGTSYQKVFHLLKTGEIMYFEVGGEKRILLSDLLVYSRQKNSKSNQSTGP